VQSQIEKAVVLAAGFGERLRPLTERMPKPLLPVWGVPLIERTLRALEAAGVREVAVNLHWMAGPLQTFLSGRRGPATVRFSPEPEILGTGGALRPLRDWLGDAPFWLVNGDIVWHADLAPLVAAFYRRGRIAAAWLDPRRGPRTVACGPRGDIETFRSPAPRSRGTATFCGVQLVSPALFDFFPGETAFSIVDAYERAQAAQRPVAGVRLANSYWCDAGTVERYLRTHADLKRLAARGQPAGAAYAPDLDTYPSTARAFCCDLTGRGVRAPGSVLLPGAAIGPGGRMRRSVAKQATVTRPVADAVVVPATACGEAVMPRVIEALGWPDAAAVFLGRRGSARRFWRLMPADGGPGGIVVIYSRERPENARYAGHAALLTEAGVPVPRVLADLPDADTVVLEDWGDRSLLCRMQRAGADPAALYEPVLQAAVALHTRATALARLRGAALEPAFDAAVYGWEHDLFEHHLLRGRYGLAGIGEAVREDLETVSRRLAGAPHVVVHRDFQSSNILFRGRRIALIDFQGMRFGPAAYDLASLLCDPYVALDDSARSLLLRRYATLCGDTGGLEIFSWAAVQRLLQALGAYARLDALGLPFARYIPTALALAHRQAQTCGLRALAGVLRDSADRERVTPSNSRKRAAE
jgi:NDP-sugar pyrophosphorylase family protein/aminoglycoside/choline kinase family phosphotransferase